MKRMVAITALLTGLSPICNAFAEGVDMRVFTLYRSSVGILNARIHVATFDAGAFDTASPADRGAMTDDDAAKYNGENCQIAASLFREQPGIIVIYWCEPGRAPGAVGSQ